MRASPWTLWLVALTALGGCRRHGGLSKGALDAAEPEVRSADGAAGTTSPPMDASSPSMDASSPSTDASADRGALGDVDGDARPRVYSYRARMHALSPGRQPIPDQDLTISLVTTTPPMILAAVPGVLARSETTQGGLVRHETRTRLELPDQSTVGLCLSASYFYEIVDATFDADSLRGDVQGVYEFGGGDFISSSRFTGTLEGLADQEAPTVSLDPAELATSAGGVSPMGRLRFVANKPLKRGVQAALLGSDGSKTLLQGEGMDPDAVVAFTFDGALTKFGATYKVVFSPALEDLAGHVGQVSVVVTSAPDPGALAFDGFEGPVAAVGSQPVIMSDVFGLPAITGRRSLVIGAGDGDGYVVMRLKVARANATVHLSFRGVDQRLGYRRGNLGVRLAAPGRVAESHSFPLWAAGDPGQDVSASRNLSAVTEISLPLPAGTVDEVFLELRLPFTCPLPDEQPALVLVDDVRIE